MGRGIRIVCAATSHDSSVCPRGDAAATPTHRAAHVDARARARERDMPARPCFKCGERGHVARDCTAPRERWIPEEARRAILNATSARASDGTARDASDAGADAGVGTGVNARGKRSGRRPKFSVHEHLLGPNGLGVVYATFPERFRAASRGEGHERTDLETLLAMYREWAVKMYPYAPADETLARVRRLGNDKAVKAAVREFHERDYGGGVGERVAAMERGENVADGEDVVFPDDEDGDDGADDGGAGDDDGFLDDDDGVAFPDDADDLDEEDYVFEDEDAADAMREADAANGKAAADDDDDETAFPDDEEEDSDDDEPTGKRTKQVKGATDSTKKAFEKLAKKLGKTTDEPETVVESGVLDATNVPLLSPQRKILRTRPKALDPSSDEEDEPEEPVRRRRAVHGMDDDDDE